MYYLLSGNGNGNFHVFDVTEIDMKIRGKQRKTGKSYDLRLVPETRDDTKYQRLNFKMQLAVIVNVSQKWRK